MFRESVRKVSNKIKESTENSKAPLVNPIRKTYRRKAIFAGICISIIVLIIAIPGVGSDNLIGVSGSVSSHGVGIYRDQACTSKVSSIDLGLVLAGSNNTLIVFVKNEGNSTNTLYLKTLRWTPSTSLDYISLNWNYSGQVINVGQVVPLKLTLSTVSTPRGITGFSFDTIISSTS